MDYKKISFCTVAMNRLHHVQETVKKNIEDNLSYPDLEYVLLDYNSSDGLEQWVFENMNDYVEKGILKYYKTVSPSCFNRTHSRNLLFKLSTGDIICNIDADNYAGEGFAHYTNEQFFKQKNIFLVADTKKREYFLRNAFGRFCVEKSDFLKIGGLDESMDGYGAETIDFYDRLLEFSIDEVIIPSKFLNAIAHGDEERVNNEYFLQNLDFFYINYVDVSQSKVLMGFKDNTYKLGTLKTAYDQVQLPAKLLEDQWIEGEWELGGERLLIRESGKEDIYFQVLEDYIELKSEMETEKYHKISDYNFINKAAKDLPFITNTEKIRERSKHNIVVNSEGFGKDTVYENFTKRPLIII